MARPSHFAAILCGLLSGGLLSGGCSVTPTASVVAGCPSDAEIDAVAARIVEAAPVDGLAVPTMAAGLCAQSKLVHRLQRRWGAPIGYKAGLTGTPAQQRFGVDQPVRGVLLAGMMLADGATVAHDWGALPRYEADLVLVVGEAAINDATTPADVLASISAIHPFIELPDLVVADPGKLTGPVIAAINVGARLGVLGPAITPETTDAFVAALADMTVVVTDQDGGERAAAPGAAVLGHPLNAALWLRDSGVRFKPGDLISTGSIGPPLKPEPGLTATVTYRGLPGNPSVSVTFK